MSSARPSVIVIGATSHLGQSVLRRLLASECHVSAITRNTVAAKILLGDFADRLSITTTAALRGGSVGADSVINLAYVKSEKPQYLLRRNAEFIRSVTDVTRATGARRLVHASTMAVFGYGPERPFRVARAPFISGDPYVESKRQAEELLLSSKLHGTKLEIVRLGNIIGEGSPAWVAKLGQRILEGRPVGVFERDGFSNATFAENTADYLVQLAIGSLAGAQAETFHHLAEFSSVRWSTFTDAFGEAIGLAPTSAASLGAQAAETSRAKRAASWLKRLAAGSAGGYLRAALRARISQPLANWVAARSRVALTRGSTVMEPIADAEDANILRVLCAQVEFSSHTLPSWSPPVSLEAAIRRMQQWLVDSYFAQAQSEPPRA